MKKFHLLVALVLLGGSAVQLPAQNVKAAAGKINVAVDLPENLNLGLRELVQAYNASLTGRSSALTHDQMQSVLADFPLARADDEDRLIVDIYLDGKASIDDVVSRLQALGCKIESRVDWYQNGALAVWLPVNRAAEAGRLTGVHVVNLSLKPKHYVGKVTSQGAFVQKIEALTGITPTTTQLGKLGAGIMVGALSDSFDKLKTTGTGNVLNPIFAADRAADDVASFDLPGSASHPFGNTTPVSVLKDYTSSSGVEDEGRGMLQIIHDEVPQAKLAFYTADISEVDFAAGIVALQQAGCNVICDDVGYFDEPMFSDGIVGQAIDRVVAAGAVYFSSAGNDDAAGYTGTFTPVTNDGAGGTAQTLLANQGVVYTGVTTTEQAVITDFHAFGYNTDGTPILVQNVRIPGTSADSAGYMSFQWDDPFVTQTIAAVGAVPGTAATNNVTTDFDILVFNGATGAYLSGRSGTTNNYTSKQPIERPGTTLAPATNYKIVIARTNRAAASATPNLATHLKYTVDSNDTPIRGDFITIATSNTHGHNQAAGCIGTAAYRYDSSPVVDVRDPSHAPYPIVEQFSSNGPVSIYFDSTGNRLSGPVVRKQPVLSATNGVSTSFFPPVSATSGTAPAPPGPANPSPYDFNGDGYPNFFGTSAAAPSAAGVAAILLGVAKENSLTLSPADVRTLMTSTTQTNEDQTPNYAVGTAGNTKIVASGYARTDNNAYTVSYNGAAGSTLSQITIDLSTIGVHFDSTTAIPTDTSTTATATGVVVSAFNGTTAPPGFTAPSVASYTLGTGSGGTANSLLTVTFNNFSPGSTLKFGIGRRNDGTNVFAQLSEVLGGQTPTSPGALVSSTESGTVTPFTGRFVNTFQQKWNYKTGYGLINAQAAVARLLGQ